MLAGSLFGLVVAVSPLARSDLASLLDTHTDDDVVIRPVPVTRHGRIHWPLTRPGGLVDGCHGASDGA